MAERLTVDEMTTRYAGRTYKLGAIDVPVMDVSPNQTVCLRVPHAGGSVNLWVRVEDLESAASEGRA